jgi:hypothetical protein
MVIRQQSWPFEEFRNIVVRHEQYEGSFFTSIGLKHATGRVVWLASFPAPRAGLSEEASAVLN